MNPAASESPAGTPAAEDLFPHILPADGMGTSPANLNGRIKGRSLVHGLPLQITYAAVDAFFVILSGAFMLWLRYGIILLLNPRNEILPSSFDRTYLNFFLLNSILVVLCCLSQDLYSTPRDRGFMDETLMVVKAVGLATTLLAFAIFAFGNKDLSRIVITGSGAISIVTLAGWRAAKREFLLRRTAAGIGVSRVLIAGAELPRRALARWLEENRHLGYEVCGFLVANPNGDPRELGAWRDLRSVALANFADELFITLPLERELVKELAREARRLRLGLRVVLDTYDGLTRRASLHYLAALPVMDLTSGPAPAFRLALKRIMDFSLASLGLIITAPLLALAALWIHFDSPGPIFYVAPRVGRKGRKFRCYKLRTMVANADEYKEELRTANEREGAFFKMQNDPRLTRSGKWLRRFSIDELPQLINVWLGDMSLVGPRPHPVDDFERYTVEDLRRLDVKPGVTGLWQVTARRDPSFATNVALDLEYIEKWSLWLDVKILLKTVPEVFRGNGH